METRRKALKKDSDWVTSSHSYLKSLREFNHKTRADFNAAATNKWQTLDDQFFHKIQSHFKSV